MRTGKGTVRWPKDTAKFMASIGAILGVPNADTRWTTRNAIAKRRKAMPKGDMSRTHAIARMPRNDMRNLHADGV